MKLSKPLVLTGMMGSGKSSAGKGLAACLQIPFVDLDEEIERGQGKPIRDLFSEQGEAAFRAIEKKKLAELLQKPPAVIATGGGAILDEGSRRLLQDKAIVIWLKADVGVLAGRIAADGTRPLLKGEEPKTALTRILAEREPFYAQAPLTVLNNGSDVDQVVEEILRALHNYTHS
jgi:shikimate kinase